VFGETAGEVLQDKPVTDRIADHAAVGIDPVGFIEDHFDEAQRMITAGNEARAALAAAEAERDQVAAEVCELENKIALARERAFNLERIARERQHAYEQIRDALRRRAAGPPTHHLYVWLCVETRNDVQIKIGRTTNLVATERTYKRAQPKGRFVFSAPISNQNTPDEVENAAQALLPQYHRIRGEQNGLTETFVISTSLYRELLKHLQNRPQPFTRDALGGFTGGRLC
jgi:hypothetical protein